MRVKIDSPGEHDRHEAEVRFVAKVEGQPVSFTITDAALFLVGEALGMTPTEPLTVYAASGSLLKEIVECVLRVSGEMQSTYLISNHDVLRVTGSEDGLPHVPRPWKARR